MSNPPRQMHQSLPPGISLVTAADGFKEWHMDIRVLDPNPLYLNQIYRLRFRFSNNYPIGNIPLPNPQPPPLEPASLRTLLEKFLMTSFNIRLSL